MRTIGTNFLLALGSTLAVFVGLECVIDRELITLVPLRLQFAIPIGERLLAQGSKRARLPENYIALAGDSYAQGKGDWLLEADPDRNSPYHSADRIHARTGRDVVSFGKAGAGNLRALAVEPIAHFRFVRERIDDAIEEPAEIWAYFYAGNDLENNLEELGNSGGRDPESAARERIAARKDERGGDGPWGSRGTNRGWLAAATWKLVRNIGAPSIDPDVPLHAVPAGRSNRVRVGDRLEEIPDALQGPALALDDVQRALAVRVFAVSLRALTEAFAGSKVTVIYVPSVLEVYQVASPRVSHADRLHPPSGEIDAAELAPRSNALCRAIEAASLAVPGVRFIDARPSVRVAGARELIHGPRDWEHFNRSGYEALVAGILDLPHPRCLDIMAVDASLSQ